MGATVVAAGAWDTVREARLAPAAQPVDADGASVAIFTDIPQPEREIVCTVREQDAEDDAEPQEVEPATLDLVVTQEGATWYLEAFLPEGSDGLLASCEPTDEVADNASYAVAVAEGWQSRANTGNGISSIATLAGAALAVWTWVARRRHRRGARP